MLRHSSTATHRTLRALCALRARAKELKDVQNMKHLYHIERCITTIMSILRKHAARLPQALKNECNALEEECCVLDEQAYRRIRLTALGRYIEYVSCHNQFMCPDAHNANIERFYVLYRPMRGDPAADELERQFIRACDRFQFERECKWDRDSQYCIFVASI